MFSLRRSVSAILPAVVAGLLGCIVVSRVDGREPTAADQERVLAVLRHFDAEPLGPLAPITHHTWSTEQKAAAGDFSQLEIVADDASSSHCARVRITERFPWNNRTEHRVLTIGPDYLPPEADAVRMRVKVTTGKFELKVGSPTVYFGHSDVLSESREVTAAAGGKWQTIEFSLHHRLTRNFRRARFGRESPVVYYTRWIQEPLYLHAGKASAGEILIDQVELISRGEGRPYPEFAAAEVRHVATIADFEDEAEMDRAFTFFQEPIDFSRPPYLVRPDWRPPQLARVKAERDEPAPGIPAAGGRYALRFEQRGTEETCFAGVKTKGETTTGAGALAIDVLARHGGGSSEVVVDFVVYAAPAGMVKTFPWSTFKPPASWQGSPEAFTYYLGENQGPEVSYAFYHVRRTLPNGRWTKLVLPLADFICAYGRNDAAAMFREQRPLTEGTMMAVGWTAPYGARRHPTVLLIDRIDLVRVPAEAQQHRSFPQAPLARAEPE
jgi:hypothetical protein